MAKVAWRWKGVTLNGGNKVRTSTKLQWQGFLPFKQMRDQIHSSHGALGTCVVTSNACCYVRERGETGREMFGKDSSGAGRK